MNLSRISSLCMTWSITERYSLIARHGQQISNMIFHSVLWMIRQFTIYWYKHIFQKRADISWSLFLFVIFLSEYRSNKSVKRQSATVFVWADENEKKISLFIFLTHQRDHHHYAMDSTTYLEKYGNLIFFYISSVSIFGQNQPIFKKKIHYLFY